MAAALYDRTGYTVYTRSSWSNTWAVFAYLEVVSITQVAAPSIPQARFRWRAGMIKREDASTFASVPHIDFAQYWVRVDFHGGPGGDTPHTVFVGRFGEFGRDRGGNDGGAPQADQEVVAYGLVAELERVKIRSSVIDTGYIADANRPYQRIDTPIAFNEDLDRGLGRQGNRSAAEFLVDPDEPAPEEGQPDLRTRAYVIAGRGAGTLDPPAVWSAIDILRHILLFHAQPVFLMRIVGEADTLAALSNYKPPRLQAFGRTVKEVIDDLIDRRRGFGWCLDYTDTGIAQFVDLRVWTLVDTVVTFGVDGSVPANASAGPLALDDNGSTDLPALSEVRYMHDASSAFGTIIVQGEPIVSCATYSFADSTLAPAWTSDEEVPYKSPGGDNARHNDQLRAEDKFDGVYRHLRVPLTWDGKVKDGENQGAQSTAVPIATDAASIQTVDGPNPAVGPLRNWGLRFMRGIPFLKEQNLGTTRPEYRDMLVLIKDQNGKYVSSDSVTLTGIGNVGPLQHELGVKIGTPAGGNHVLARNHWSGAEASEVKPLYDYEDVIVTAAMRLDQRLRAVETISGNDPKHVLLIQVPDAELWYVAPGTILGVNADGTFIRHTDSSIVRDDGPRLRQIAAMAKAWYGKVRTPATFVCESIVRDDPGADDDKRIRLGRYVTIAVDAGGTTQVNSVITSIAWDVARQRTVIQTGHAELDLTRGHRPGRRGRLA